jgi:beta-glucanase (GH16 family)
MKKNRFQALCCLVIAFIITSCNETNETNEPQNTPVPAVVGMAISPSSLQMKAGETQAPTIRVAPENAVPGAIVWTSANEKVATVAADGIITAIAYGKTSIRAVDVTHSVEASCEVTVEETARTYKLVWSDEFDGTSINGNNWNFETGGAGWGNKELQYYTDRSANARIENGCLIIEAKKESYQTNAYTSARITTQNKKYITYGKVEARISLPAGQGTWPAFWMMPNKSVYGGWPRSGEIDIMEHIGSDPRMISHAVHTQQASGGRCWSSRGYYDDVENDFHTYAIEWIKEYQSGNDAIIFYVDGVQSALKNQGNYLTGTYSDWPFDQDFYVILNLAVGGTMGGNVDNRIFDNPVQMKVDYVRIYE